MRRLSLLCFVPLAICSSGIASPVLGSDAAATRALPRSLVSFGAEQHPAHEVLTADASAAAVAPDPHAAHVMPPTALPAATAPSAPAPAPAQATPPDPHAAHAMPAPVLSPDAAAQSAPPVPPSERAADLYFDPRVIADARARLQQEHGGVAFSQILLNILELQPASDETAYRWDGEAWYGGDLNRVVFKTEGEGLTEGGLEELELQALYSRAVHPYFDLQFGLRQDFEPTPSRTYATLGVEGLAPLFYDVEAALFLSTRGEIFGRASAWFDQRITQRLILQPRIELNYAAQTVAELGVGAGLSDIELGVRLRYEFRREFAPYIGISYERKIGGSADYARAVGDDIGDAQFVVGIRAFH